MRPKGEVEVTSTEVMYFSTSLLFRTSQDLCGISGPDCQARTEIFNPLLFSTLKTATKNGNSKKVTSWLVLDTHADVLLIYFSSASCRNYRFTWTVVTSLVIYFFEVRRIYLHIEI